MGKILSSTFFEKYNYIVCPNEFINGLPLDKKDKVKLN